MISPRTRDRLQYLKSSGYSKMAAAAELGISEESVAKYWNEDRTLLKSDDPLVKELTTIIADPKTDPALIRRMGAALMIRELSNPRRILAVTDKIHKLALQGKTNVLLEIMRFFNSQQREAGGVVVNVQTSIKIDPTKQYDITGETIEVVAEETRD